MVENKSLSSTQVERVYLDDSSLGFILASLLVAHLFVTVAHTALNNTRVSFLKEQNDHRKQYAKYALRLLDSRLQLAVAVSFTTTLAYTLFVMIFALQVIAPIIAQYGVLAGAGATLLVAVLVLIVATLAPEGIASVHADTLTRFTSIPLYFWVRLITPITVLLVYTSKALASVFGGSEMVNTVTEEEIMTLVNAGEIEEGEKDMIYSVLQLDQRDARQLMVPRMDIEAIEVGKTVEDALDVFIESGFSRIPVYEDNIDNVAGLLYAKDLLLHLRKGGTLQHPIREMVRPAFFVPETLEADALLRTLQTRNIHMAIVVDEYGGTAGLVTIENLIEEIIGDIRDEYDQDEEVEYTQLGENEYLIDASMNIADINDLLDLSIDDTEYDTLGGYIYTEMGHVPHVDETLEMEKFTLTVRSIEGRRIRQVHFIRKQPDGATETPVSDELPPALPSETASNTSEETV